MTSVDYSATATDAAIVGDVVAAHVANAALVYSKTSHLPPDHPVRRRAVATCEHLHRLARLASMGRQDQGDVEAVLGGAAP